MITKKTDIERDKINQTIHEARGLCAHIDIEYEELGNMYGSIGRWRCKRCKSYNFVKDGLPDYTTDWSAWGAALKWAQKQEWWDKFAYHCAYDSTFVFDTRLLNPELGSARLAKFIDENPEYFKKEEKR